MSTRSVALQPPNFAQPRSLHAALAGGAIAIGATSLFAMLFLVSALQTTADGAGIIPLVGVPIVATLAAGVAFARLIGPSRHERVAWRSAFGVGLTFVVASFLGFMGALAIESTGIRQPDSPRLMLFRLAFVVGSALVAFTSVSGASWILGRRGWFRRALTVAGVTAATYVVVVLVLDLIPGWHVGGGNLAMLKVASVGNFCAGLAGGTVAYWLMTRASLEAFSSEEPGA